MSGYAFLLKSNGAYSGRLTGGAFLNTSTNLAESSEAISCFGSGADDVGEDVHVRPRVTTAGLLWLGVESTPAAWNSFSICFTPGLSVSLAGATWVTRSMPSALARAA